MTQPPPALSSDPLLTADVAKESSFALRSILNWRHHPEPVNHGHPVAIKAPAPEMSQRPLHPFRPTRYPRSLPATVCSPALRRHFLGLLGVHRPLVLGSALPVSQRRAYFQNPVTVCVREPRRAATPDSVRADAKTPLGDGRLGVEAASLSGDAASGSEEERSEQKEKPICS